MPICRYSIHDRVQTREYGWCVIDDIDRRSDQCWYVVRDERGDRRVIPESSVVGL